MLSFNCSHKINLLGCFSPEALPGQRASLLYPKLTLFKRHQTQLLALFFAQATGYCATLFVDENFIMKSVVKVEPVVLCGQNTDQEQQAWQINAPRLQGK